MGMIIFNLIVFFNVNVSSFSYFFDPIMSFFFLVLVIGLFTSIFYFFCLFFLSLFFFLLRRFRVYFWV